MTYTSIIISVHYGGLIDDQKLMVCEVILVSRNCTKGHCLAEVTLIKGYLAKLHSVAEVSQIKWLFDEIPLFC